MKGVDPRGAQVVNDLLGRLEMDLRALQIPRHGSEDRELGEHGPTQSPVVVSGVEGLVCPGDPDGDWPGPPAHEHGELPAQRLRGPGHAGLFRMPDGVLHRPLGRGELPGRQVGVGLAAAGERRADLVAGLHEVGQARRGFGQRPGDQALRIGGEQHPQVREPGVGPQALLPGAPGPLGHLAQDALGVGEPAERVQRPAEVDLGP